MTRTRELGLVAVAAFAIGFGAGHNSKAGRSGSHVAGATLASVNGVAVTAGDVKRRLDSLPPLQRQAILNARGLRQFLDNLVTQELLRQDAKRLGVADAPDLQAQLDDYRDNLVSHHLYEALFQKNVHVSEQDLRDFFERNRALFIRPASKKGAKPEPKTFEEARAEVEQQVTTMKRSEALRNYLKTLKDGAKITVDEAGVGKLQAEVAKSRP